MTSVPTRRDTIKYGGSATIVGLLAGCSSGEPTTTDGEPTATPTASRTDAGYSATMAPMGTVEFETVPESVYTGLPNTADMAVAAGQSDAINAIYYPQYHGTLMNNFYERLDGVSLAHEDLTDSWGLSKEGFYDLDSDVHLTDPAYASTLEALDRSDVEEIRENVAPWFGNYYSDRHREPPGAWSNGYEFYSLWDIFARTAEVFRAGDRARALADVHTEMLSTIEERLPPADERPTAALAFKGEGEMFYVYRLNVDGFLTAHTRPLGADDAFGDATFEGAGKQVDYEAMLETDPDVLLVLFTMASSYSIADIRETLREDDVASEISAVRNDRVHAQGARYQGPLLNLFQLEMTAKQLYPEQFGEWPGYVDGEPYPEIPSDEQLFDRDRVAAIVNGED